jgi:hypothetical protein
MRSSTRSASIRGFPCYRGCGHGIRSGDERITDGVLPEGRPPRNGWACPNRCNPSCPRHHVQQSILGLVLCEERKQLVKIYVDAVRNTTIAGMRILDAKSEAWREATREARAACDVALTDLNAHREAHGC